ncbi:hypothetical protein [Oceanicoccus sagamiensis]|uniref:hypothetical protein n=1 Tax=Oceanicoccus sagamiensis TaxID=716816 RepID=UPI0012F4A1A4|nr:hypothetical protein [Oceanicoccus sagamiensis]
MNALHRSAGLKPDLPAIEFSPSTPTQNTEPQTGHVLAISRDIEEKDKPEDIFDWLSSH